MYSMQTAALKTVDFSDAVTRRQCEHIIRGKAPRPGETGWSFRSDRTLFRLDRYTARYGYTHPLAGLVNEALHTIANWNATAGAGVDGHFNEEFEYGNGKTWADVITE